MGERMKVVKYIGLGLGIMISSIIALVVLVFILGLPLSFVDGSWQANDYAQRLKHSDAIERQLNEVLKKHDLNVQAYIDDTKVHEGVGLHDLTTVKAKLTFVRADGAKLHRTVQLANNGYKKLSVQDFDQVTDSGYGMSDELFKKLFHKAYGLPEDNGYEQDTPIHRVSYFEFENNVTMIDYLRAWQNDQLQPALKNQKLAQQLLVQFSKNETGDDHKLFSVNYDFTVTDQLSAAELNDYVNDQLEMDVKHMPKNLPLLVMVSSTDNTEAEKNEYFHILVDDHNQIHLIDNDRKDFGTDDTYIFKLAA